MKKIVILLILMILPAVMAQNIQVYKQSIGHMSSLSKNTWYNTSISFMPKSLGRVVSAFITLYGDINAETDFDVMVNGVACNPPTYSIPGGVRQEKMVFDCTNAINYGNYTVSLRFRATSGTAYFRNMYGEVEVIYTSIPSSINIFGTEYTTNEDARVFVQVLSEQSTPVNDAVCSLNIYYPDLTKFVDSEAMIFFERGLYFYDFVTPNITGVYMLDVVCVYPNVKETIYPLESSALFFLDGNTYTMTGSMNITFNTTLSTPFYAYFYAILDKPTTYADVYIQKGNNWEYYGRISYTKPTLSKLITNYTEYTPTFRVNVYGAGTPKVYMDLANLVIFQPSNVTLTNLRGGGEVHVGILEDRMKTYAEGMSKNITQGVTDTIRSIVENATLNITVDITGNISKVFENVSKGFEDLTSLLIALHSTPETYSVCYNQTYRLVTKMTEWQINGIIYNITKNEMEYCQFGCNERIGVCNDSPVKIFAILFGLLAISMAVFFIYRRFG